MSYDIFGPALYLRRDESADGLTAALRLRRRLLRWTVYRYSIDRGFIAWERVSHHWTRRSAWRASSRLRFAAQDSGTGEA